MTKLRELYLQARNEHYKRKYKANIIQAIQTSYRIISRDSVYISSILFINMEVVE